jgi:putative SOS response-associated peptidase YedK
MPNLLAWLDAMEILAEFDREQLSHGRYNVAPTTQVPVLIRREEAVVARMMRWGFVPTWCTDEKPRLVNCARAETVATSGYFKRAFKTQRCIFLASGFYEWHTTPEGKQPYNIRNADGSPLLMAGIWDRWREQDTAAIITTGPNAMMLPIHERMPVMISQDCIRDWLTTAMPEHYLVPAPDAQLEAYAVTNRVNSVRNDGPDLIAERHLAGITVSTGVNS